MITEQSLTDVGRLLKELPDNQKEVLYMRFYQDLSFKEIADATGVSINTALGRMRYGLINLRKMVSERGIVLEVYWLKSDNTKHGRRLSGRPCKNKTQQIYIAS